MAEQDEKKPPLSPKDRMALQMQKNTAQHVAADNSVPINLGHEHRKLPVASIEPCKFQPRRQFDPEKLQQLADTIIANELIEPIVVRPHPSGEAGRYELIAGERRWRAHQLAKLNTIEAIVQHRTDEEVAQMVLVENMQREDLTDYEVGMSLVANEKLFSNRTDMALRLGMNREDMYRYLAFKDLPAFILQDLNEAPGLLGRSAASELRGVLAKYTLNETVLTEVWQMVKDGSLLQKELGGTLTRLAKGEGADVEALAAAVGVALPADMNAAGEQAKQVREGVQRRVAAIRATKQVTRMKYRGKAIGTFTRDNKSMVIKLKGGILPAEKEAKLQRFVEQLLAEEDDV